MRACSCRCIFHSFIIGLALGVNQTDGGEVRALLIALAFHQWLEGISLASVVSIADFSLWKRFSVSARVAAPSWARGASTTCAELGSTGAVDVFSRADACLHMVHVCTLAGLTALTGMPTARVHAWRCQPGSDVIPACMHGAVAPPPAHAAVLRAPPRPAPPHPPQMIVVYSLTCPVGVAIGIGIAQTYNSETDTARGLQGSFNGVSGGMLLYISLVQLIAEDMSRAFQGHSGPRVRLLSYAFLLLGGGLMCMLAVWA